jgi:hypothetical protein
MAAHAQPPGIFQGQLMADVDATGSWIGTTIDIDSGHASKGRGTKRLRLQPQEACQAGSVGLPATNCSSSSSSTSGTPKDVPDGPQTLVEVLEIARPMAR